MKNYSNDLYGFDKKRIKFKGIRMRGASNFSYRKLERRGSVSVAGQIELTTNGLNAESDDHIVVDSRIIPIKALSENRKLKSVGYIHADDYTVYRVVKKNSSKQRLLVVLLIVMLALILKYITVYSTTIQNWFILGNPSTVSDDVDYAEGDEWDGSLHTNEGANVGNIQTMQIPGYTDFTLTKDITSVDMPNYKSNPCSIQYTITEEVSKKVIYESKPVLPGQVIHVELYSKLKEGETSIVITRTPKLLEDGSICNVVSTPVTVSVIK